MSVASVENSFILMGSVVEAIRINLMDCFRYREVLYNLLARDLKVKYKRTFFGYFWSLLNPVLQLTVLTVVFSHVVRLGMRDYTLYLFSGLLAWTFFYTSVMTASRSFLENENLIKKIYLPKILFPVCKVLLRSIDFLFSLLALTLIGTVFGFAFKLTVFLIPIAIGFLFLFTIGSAIIVAIATAFFRDVEYLLSVFLQLLYFATPVLYPLSVLPEKYHFFMKLNPLYSQVRVFQCLVYDGVLPSGSEWSAAAAVSLATFVLGLWLMRAVEDEIVFRM